MSLRAEDVMTNRFLRISTEHSLREALGLILYGEERDMDTGAIVVIDVEGDFAGILTPNCVVKGLGGFGAESASDQKSFLELVDQHLPDTVDKVMKTDELPKLSKDSSLCEIIHLMGASQHECIPVLEDRRVVGLVYATEIFKAAANLALTPGEEGIEIDR